MTAKQLWIRRVVGFLGLFAPAFVGGALAVIWPDSAIASVLVILGVVSPALTGLVLLCMPRKVAKWAGVRAVGYWAVGMSFLLEGILRIYSSSSEAPRTDPIAPAVGVLLLSYWALRGSKRQRQAYEQAASDSSAAPQSA